MRKCDSCGKVVVNEQDYMCPHCGAVSRKKCDHSTHLPDDKYNRANDYRTTAAEHKSKTYNYEKTPRTDANQKFDINDLANIKNAEDAKRIAKKAFIEQEQNGRKKFKPLAIVLIVIFAVNIFGNLLSAVGDVVGEIGDELEYAFEDIALEDYTLGVDEITHDFSVLSTIDGVSYNKESDCLTIDFSELYFQYNGSMNEEYETIEREWTQGFTYPSECFYTGSVIATVGVFDETEVSDRDLLYDYDREISLKGELSDLGFLNIYGLEPHIRALNGRDVYLNLSSVRVLSENEDTNEHFDCWVSLPANFIKLSPDNTIELYNIYADFDVVVTEELDYNEQYIPEEYVESIGW